MDQDDYTQKTRVFQVKVPFDKGREFESVCNSEHKTVNAKLKELIDDATKSKRKDYFRAGKNLLEYDKKSNTFSWKAKLDDEKEKIILEGLNLDFIKNIKEESEKAIIERNEWVHGKNTDSVEFPNKLLEGEDE